MLSHTFIVENNFVSALEVPILAFLPSPVTPPHRPTTLPSRFRTIFQSQVFRGGGWTTKTGICTSCVHFWVPLDVKQKRTHTQSTGQPNSTTFRHTLDPWRIQSVTTFQKCKQLTTEKKLKRILECLGFCLHQQLLDFKWCSCSQVHSSQNIHFTPNQVLSHHQLRQIQLTVNYIFKGRTNIMSLFQ